MASTDLESTSQYQERRPEYIEKIWHAWAKPTFSAYLHWLNLTSNLRQADKQAYIQTDIQTDICRQAEDRRVRDTQVNSETRPTDPIIWAPIVKSNNCMFLMRTVIRGANRPLSTWGRVRVKYEECGAVGSLPSEQYVFVAFLEADDRNTCGRFATMSSRGCDHNCY